jgi:hypothetical protein
MKTLFQKTWKPLLLLLPLLISLIGFLQAGEGLLQALFNCVCMYTLNYQDIPANTLVELGRWLAPLATAGSVVLVISALRRCFRNFLARCTRKSVAVYGANQEQSFALKQLGLRGIALEDKPVKAHQYILLGTEAENLAFYRENQTFFAQRDVYLKCRSLPAQASTHAKLHLFCPEETAARVFWKQHCPYERSLQQNHQLKIVFLGFQKLGRELLLQGLQNNIFHADQRIEYHIFGSEDGFTRIYHQLPQISDPVTFHAGPWQEQLSLLQQADMVILLQQEDPIAILRDLDLALPGKTIHVFSADPVAAAMLPNARCFDWLQATCDPQHILGDRLHAYAQKINLRYAHLYAGIAETEANKKAQWEQLDTFTRYSNISAADYHGVQQKMLALAGIADPIGTPWLEQLAELEHIRWCRYHYLNNWTYGIPEDGKNKDPRRRIHTMLIPYDRLSDQEKEKDRENVRILFALDAEN